MQAFVLLMALALVFIVAFIALKDTIGRPWKMG